MIERALSPAKISTIRLDKEKKHAEVFLHPDEVSLAIGKGGLNIKLAINLTGYDIDVYRDIDENDIYLEEFKDEIELWIIEALKNIGCATAMAVLNTPREILIEKADLEEDTVDEVLRVLRAQFEDAAQ
jgi:N utilization substance protein A